MWPWVIAVFVVLGALSLRGVRWAYVTYILLSLLFFPAQTGFRFESRACDLSFGMSHALAALANYPHMVLFGLFFVATMAQFRQKEGSAFAWAGSATMLMGAAVELEQGLTGTGHCRLRDLLPDAVGALLAATLVWGWHKARSDRSHDTA